MNRWRALLQAPEGILSEAGDRADARRGSGQGSGRSIDEYHMFKKLTEVSDLLLKFGGHPLAAGLSLERRTLTSSGAD